MHPSYFEAADPARMAAEFPVGDEFLRVFKKLSRDELRARQEKQFQQLMARAWGTGFYRRHWSAHGIEAGDIRTLDDLPTLPTYDKTQLMESIANHPPLGDFHAMETYPKGAHPPIVFHTTSGTTGKPQPLLFGPWSREVQNLLLARIYLLQGMRSSDVVHSVYGHGMINGGHYVREAVVHWTNAIFMSAGTGVETRSLTQLQLMRDFGATVIVGFADYIKRLAEIARENGIEPGRDIKIRLICGHLGRESKEQMSAAWGGAAVHDWYGVGDTGAIAAEGPDQDGLYVMEDAQFLEICDIESGRPVADGEQGDMVCTSLFKHDIYPIVRFNTHDVSKFKTTQSSLGLNLRRIEGFLGRSDNMVKLRGINVFPHAVGPILQERAEFNGQFLCKVTRDTSGRDDMLVLCEVTGPADVDAYKHILKARMGVEVDVQFVTPGALAPLTQVEQRQKPIRLVDERFA
jgi:phenylacetate-CoA ligase